MTAGARRRSVFGLGIGASALADESGEPALHRAIHEELLEDLAVHGHLIFTSPTDLQLFLAAVRSLPTSLAKAWEAVLSSKRVSVAILDPVEQPGLGDLLDPATLETRMAPDVELVLLEADQAELLGVAEDEFSARTPGGLVEIGRLATAGRTATILAARETLDAPLREGGNREVEWQERFGPLVAASQPIVIYDKYAGMQTARRYVYDYRSGDGLTWFLTRVGMQEGRRVRIITAVPFDSPREPMDEDVLALAFGRLNQRLAGRVGLDLLLVPERGRAPGGGRLERFGHDRHLRFGARAALALGIGIQAFAEARFRETVTVARLPIRDAKLREERATKAALRPPDGGWLGWSKE